MAVLMSINKQMNKVNMNKKSWTINRHKANPIILFKSQNLGLVDKIVMDYTLSRLKVFLALIPLNRENL